MNAQQETERSRREWSNYRDYVHLQGHGDDFDEADLRAMAKMKREAGERVKQIKENDESRTRNRATIKSNGF